MSSPPVRFVVTGCENGRRKSRGLTKHQEERD
jgi:hypothetical protein